MRRPLLIAACAVVTGCGGGSEPAPKPKPEAKASASAQATPAPALQRQEYMGVSVLIPSDWERYKPDDKSIDGLIYGPPGDDDKGSIGFFVTENNQSAADYVDTVILNPRNRGLKQTVRHRHKVKVQGLGSGVRFQVGNKRSDPSEQLYASSIDGLLVTLMVSPGPHPEVRRQLDRIMSSVRRES